MTEYETHRQQIIQKNREILSFVLDDDLSKELQVPIIAEDSAFETLQQIHLCAVQVQTMLGISKSAPPVPEPVIKPSKTNEGGVDVYSILALGGPSRHTRSVRRELIDFLEDGDGNTPVPKKMKTMERLKNLTSDTDA